MKNQIMKLLRFGSQGKERPGVSIDGQRKDLSAFFTDWNHDFFQNEGLERLEKLLVEHAEFPIVPDDERWAACIARPGKVLCIGLN